MYPLCVCELIVGASFKLDYTTWFDIMKSDGFSFGCCCGSSKWRENISSCKEAEVAVYLFGILELVEWGGEVERKQFLHAIKF